jgi:hypothetical protein
MVTVKKYESVIHPPHTTHTHQPLPENATAYSPACHAYTLTDTSKSNHGGLHTTGAWAIAALKPVRPQKTIPALVSGGVGEANDREHTQG